MTHDIHDAKSWPVGAPVQFASKWKNIDGNWRAHYAIGIVIGNRDGTIVVLWPEHCAEKICTYSVVSLNRASISRPW